ncbi:amidase [Alteromonadaceae bacterium BrNp21-10]|nr:amidase [Alteromonadaceae bacterium BrNp21-10]
MKSILLGCLLFFSSLVSAEYNLHELSISKTQEKLSEGSLTSEALVKYYLQRIELFDNNSPFLNSVGQINIRAIAEAQALDKERKEHGSRGPMHGIPVLLKDNIDTGDGMANTAGSLALKDNKPKYDAFLVSQLRKAGAIILGKSNLSEWANFRSTRSSSGWSGMYGQSKNPYDVTRSPCGSSSGSGIAVAADLTMVAVGTETDGSVTCPSAVNGIVGIKPTLGTVSRSGIIPIAHSQDTAGPMARNVTDAVILLQAMTAVDPKDSAATVSQSDYLSHLKTQGLKGKRIGIARDFMGYHEQVDAVFMQAVEALKAQGAVIVDDIKFSGAKEWGDAEFAVLLYEFKADLNQYLANTAEGLPKSLADLIDFNLQHVQQEMPYFAQELFFMAQEKGPLTDQEYLDALAKSKSLTQEKGIDALLAEHKLDLLIAPTNQPAWKTDHVNGDHYLGSATSAAAISGYPHITVPMGYVQGLPVGLSFFGAKLAEGTLIEAAFSYEQATQHRHPPVL